MRKRRFPFAPQGALQRRKYLSYDDYLAHQREKLDSHPDSWLQDFDRKYREVLRARLQDAGVVRRGNTVLCLAARLGTEVRAFVDLGCFAVGLDLNPGKGNKYVVCGDFHDIQFATGSIDVVFTNALDHAFDMFALIEEIKRVLVADGTLILEIVNGRREGYSPGYFEASIWERIDDVVRIVSGAGFRVVKQSPIDYPWEGRMVCFSRAGSL